MANKHELAEAEEEEDEIERLRASQERLKSAIEFELDRLIGQRDAKALHVKKLQRVNDYQHKEIERLLRAKDNRMTEAKMNEAALAQSAYNAMAGHPLVLAFTNLISAHYAVMQNGAPIDILKNAQASLSAALSIWISQSK